MKISSLDDIGFAGRVVLLRVDINSPLDPTTKLIVDDSRLDKALPTIKELADAGARVVVLAHQGDTLDYHNLTSLREHATKLSSKLGRPVRFIDDVAGPAARAAIKQLGDGDILLLDNVRYLTEEVSTFEEGVKLSASDMTATYLVSNLAPLADVYVNDAFAAAHRDSPSMVAFQELLPSVGGRLLVQETNALTRIAADPIRPCVFLIGGLKVSDAFAMMSNVLADGTADRILTSGITANIMIAARDVDLGGPTMSFIAERSLDSFIPQAADLLSTFGDRIDVPIDFAFDEDGTRGEVDATDLPVDRLIVDIGTRTVARYERTIADAATLFVNGPAGVYESPAGEYGTRSLWNAVAAAHATSVIGGGDTVASARRFIDLSDISFVSTGGGALIRYLSGQNLPLLDAMERAAVRLESA